MNPARTGGRGSLFDGTAVTRGFAVTRWLVHVRYTAQAASEIVEAGLTNRKQVVTEMAAVWGGKVVQFWATSDSAWDVAYIVETDNPTPIGSALSMRARGIGRAEAMHWEQLIETEEFDPLVQR